MPKKNTPGSVKTVEPKRLPMRHGFGLSPQGMRLGSSRTQAAFSKITRERYPDSKPLTEAQRKKVCEMLHSAFLEIRSLGRAGKARQAGNLANAFHNVPTLMWSDEFSLEYFRDSFLKPYQAKYTEPRHSDYVALVDEIIQMPQSVGDCRRGSDTKTNRG